MSAERRFLHDHKPSPLQVAHDSPGGDSRLGSTNTAASGSSLIERRSTVLALRGPGESYSDVIMRLAKAHQQAPRPGVRHVRLELARAMCVPTARQD